jgi:hypothetical protein
VNVLDFIVAVFVIQPLLMGLGLLGYRLQPRRPPVGMLLGVGAIVIAVFAFAITTLAPYLAAAFAGGVVGASAIVRRWAATLARWIALGGTVSWVVAMALVLLDAVG